MGMANDGMRIGRRHRGRSGGARRRRAGALAAARRARLDPLEPRVLLSGSILYVNDNWRLITDIGAAGLSAGDTVDNGGIGDDGALQGLTFGTNAFDTLGGAGGALATASPGDRIILVSGSYSESVTIDQGMSVEGWAYFAAASAAPATNPDPAHLTQDLLNPALVTAVNGVQWTINDGTADGVTVRGITFTNNSTAGTIYALAGNRASLAVLDNTFHGGSGADTQAIVIDAAAAPTVLNIANNSFSSLGFAVNAVNVTGGITGNSLSASLGFQVKQGQTLAISGNTAGGMLTTYGTAIPIIGVYDSGAGLVISGNHLTLVDPAQVAVIVSDTGANPVAVTGNRIDGTSALDFAGDTGILVTDYSYYGSSGGSTHATITGNHISDVWNGIYVNSSGAVPVTAVISANQIDHCNAGIRYNSPSAGTITGTRFDLGLPNATDLEIDQGDLLVLAGGDHFAATTDFVNDVSATSFTLIGDDFGTTNADLINSRIAGPVTWYLPGVVAGRQVFYQGSTFDPGPDAHDAALATDKAALLPGDTASLANYTSYDRGLNGLMVDLTGTVSGLTAADFTFKTGNDNAPDNWAVVTATPTLNLRSGAGGSTRVEITFPEGAIRNTWLQVTVHLGVHTDLANDDVFYFGNAVGESGNSPSDARVDVLDVLTARAGATGAAPITDPCDFNRDGAVNSADEALVFSNVSYFLNELQLITAPASLVPARVANVSSASKPAVSAPSTTMAKLALATPAPLASAAGPASIPAAPAPAAAPPTAALVKVSKASPPAAKAAVKPVARLARAAQAVKRRVGGFNKLTAILRRI